MFIARRIVAASGLAVGVLCAPVLGQWSGDPNVCIAVGDRPGEQGQPKLAPTPDGGCYISWLDNSTGGYDVYLQKLDAQGNELWAHNGVLVSDRGVSATFGYDLVCDGAGNALLVYNDDVVVPGTEQIQVQKVSPAGALLWGDRGVTVSDGAGFKVGPQVAALSDGGCAVAFGVENAVPILRLDATGAIAWAAPVVVTETYNPPTQPLHALSLSDLQPADNGSFVALFIRGSTSSFLSSKSLYAQKFDTGGLPLWTGTGASNGAGSPVVVFSAGATTSIGNGYQPTFLPDGAGGAVFGWYENGGQRNAYIQHVLADGTLKFPAPVANTGETPGRIRLGAALAYSAAGEYFLASPEGTQVSTVADSVTVQKFGADGSRQWGETGVHVQPIAAGSQPSFVQAVESGGGCMVFSITPSGSASGVIAGGAVDSEGLIAWSITPCAVQGTKSRLAAAKSTLGYAVLAFGHGDDVWAQNTLPDGTLGNPAQCYANCDGSTQEPMLNVADFSCFLQAFAAGSAYANCDGSTQDPVLNVADFSCFLQSFGAGCR